MCRRALVRLGAAVAPIVLSGLVVAVPAGAAPPPDPAARPSVGAGVEPRVNRCSGPRDIRYDHNAGAGLRYVECHRGSGRHRESSVTLWLWDDRTDGKCAQAWVGIGRWQHFFGWCSTRHHGPKLVTCWHPGGDARVRLWTR